VSFLRPSKRTHEGNEFRPLIDGEVAYAELAAAIRAAKRFVYIATWGFDPDLEMTRTGSGDPTIRELLLDRARAGLEVKVLVWDFLSIGHPHGTIGNVFRRDIATFRRELADAGAKAKKGSSLFLTANPVRIPGRRFATASDHQKFWVVDEAGKSPMGFVGGLNLGQHEWDTSEHRPGDRRRTSPGINRQGLELQDALKDPIKKHFVRGRVEQVLNDKYNLSQMIDALNLPQPQKDLLKNQVIDTAIEFLKKQKPLAPRHDVMSRVRGPAAAELLEEFRARWKLDGTGKLEEKASRIPPPSGGKTRLQIVHTAHYPAPGGQRDIWKAYLHALKQAERYVYIENQYFTSASVRNVLVERVQRRPDLQIVILLPRKAEEFFIGPAIALRQGELVRSIQAAARKRTPRQERVHTFGLSAWNGAANAYDDIYIHAKVALVDDEWMAIGSANTGPRSLEYDTELNAFTNDIPQVIACRRQLWSEHLNLSKDDDLFKNPLRAIRRMAETAAANAKKKSGDLNGRLVPMSFDIPPFWRRPLYEAIADEFF
jgi:phosphatidylserine/phosphatidylglycerophosphate/cardiolipin synthase-like enzyme